MICLAFAMQAVARLLLACGFMTAVILPNDIGTDQLPAVDSSVVVKADSKALEPHNSGLAVVPAALTPWTGAAFVVFAGQCADDLSGPLSDERRLLPLLI
jgi:hypothetical protein